MRKEISFFDKLLSAKLNARTSEGPEEAKPYMERKLLGIKLKMKLDQTHAGWRFEPRLL